MIIKFAEKLLREYIYRYHQLPTHVPIPATMVLRVLQRVADGTAEDVSFSEHGIMFDVYADGWQIHCMDDSGWVDGVYWCKSPDGVTAVMDDWNIEVEPTEMLSLDENDAIMRRFEQTYRKR
ncbi:MAG TPA: hypothetical protein PKD49_07625 [Hyphomicrobium sp.]|nr:hypothetical protein [Hyphomicrobium sp.]